LPAFSLVILACIKGGGSLADSAFVKRFWLRKIKDKKKTRVDGDNIELRQTNIK